MRWYDCEVEIVMALAINTVLTHASVTFSQNYQIYLWNSRNIPIKPVFVKRIKPTTMIIHHQGNCIVCVEKLSRIVVGDCEWSYSCVDIFTLGADKTSDCLWQYLYYGITLNTLNSNDMAAVTGVASCAAAFCVKYLLTLAIHFGSSVDVKSS